MFFSSIQSVLSILIIIAVGFILAKKNWFTSDSQALIGRLVVNISAPLLIIYNLTDRFTKQSLLDYGIYLLIPLIVTIISYSIAYLISMLIKVDPQKRGVFCAVFTFGNSLFIGLPINLLLFGDESLSWALLFYLSNAIFTWTVGIYGIKSDGITGSRPKFFTTETLKRVVSPPLIGFFIGIILIIFDIKLFDFLSKSFSLIGNMTTPLSLIFIGITLASIKKSDLSLNKKTFAVLMGRFMIVPAIMLGITTLFGLSGIGQNVFLIQSSMPVMAQTAILARRYNADYKFATAVVSISTILSMVLIPIYMFLLSQL